MGEGGGYIPPHFFWQKFRKGGFSAWKSKNINTAKGKKSMFEGIELSNLLLPLCVEVF